MRRTAWLVGVLVALALLPTTATAAGGLTWSGYQWHIHNGTGALGQKWSASNVSVSSDGVLHIKVANKIGGGVGMSTNRTYGTYQVRMRMSKGTGKPVVLLWPANGNRPEIDFAEGANPDPQRKDMHATWHPDMTSSHMVHYSLATDYSVWHTFGVVWKSTGIDFTVDGRVWGHSNATSHVPMHVSIAANWKPGEQVTPATVLDVAWVHLS